MTTEFKWYASDNPERYDIGPCDTRDEAINKFLTHASIEELCNFGSICLCYANKHDITDIEIDANRLLERLSDEYEDLLGDKELIDCTQEQVNELDKLLNFHFQNWIKQYNIKANLSSFKEVQKEEAITLSSEEIQERLKSTPKS